ncbi:MAG: aldo/keto reductase [Betaproteobacteria bacterium RIFCSPLOWO2_02_64_14]|nr:MAG: aldo/keto reductase [Betaproteobacteria bacterium RIFCSPLOWO2_02_64_14]
MARNDLHSPTRRRALALLAAGAAGLSRMAQAVAPVTGLLKRPIPRSGELLPVVGIGTWRTFDVGPNDAARGELKAVLRELVALGGRAIDSSPMYGEAERVVGDLAAELKLRKSLFLATKVWTSGRDAGIRQMEQSLKLMRTERLDLMQVHNLLDVATHTGTLREWKAAGRIRYLGITHYHEGAYRELERLVRTRDYDFVQFNYSMAEREADSRLLSACAESGTAVIVNRPFSHAGLFGRVKGKPLPPWAAEFDCASWAQFFLKWILGHPAVTCVIPGTGRLAHLKDNMQAGFGRLPDAAQRQRMVEHLERL